MPHPAYISMATIHLNGYGWWGHRWRHVWRRGTTCSQKGDVGLKWLQLSHRVTGGSGSEASAVNNAPDVHRWLQIRPVWISGIRFNSFSSQPSKRAACTVAGHAGWCRGPCVTTRRTSRFYRNQRVTNDYDQQADATVWKRSHVKETGQRSLSLHWFKRICLESLLVW